MAVAFFGQPAPFVWWAFLLYLCLSFVGGTFAGAIGIGGVVLVPGMLLIGVDIKYAVSLELERWWQSVQRRQQNCLVVQPGVPD